MNPRLNRRFCAARDIVARRFHDETILLDLAGGEYFSIDEVGSRIWDGICAGSTLAEVLNTLGVEYEAEAEQLERDLLVFAEELVRRRILVETLK